MAPPGNRPWLRIADWRGLGALLFVVALLLHAPGLGGGLVLDDVWHHAFLHAKLAGGEASRAWWDVFHLVDYPPERQLAMRSSGLMPWWLGPDLRVVFFRPLTSADAYLDALLWPHSPWLMHLHSTVLHALLCVLVWRLYRRILAGSRQAAAIAALAAVMFVADSTHAETVGWLAQRNATIAALFGVAAALLHVRWRTDGLRGGPLASLVLALAALLSGEIGCSLLALVLAYGLFLDPAGPRRGLVACLPVLAVAVLWLLAYAAAGFGAHGSGAYLDPLHAPATFLAALPGRLLQLTVAALGLPQRLVAGTAGSIAWAVASATILALALWHACTAKARPWLRFAAVAFALSLVPIAGAAPREGLLLFASVAANLWLAAIVVDLLLAGGRVHRIAAAFLIASRLLLAPVALVDALRAQSSLGFGGDVFTAGRGLDDQALAHQTLILVSTPMAFQARTLPLSRRLAGLQVPHFLHLLVSSEEPSTLTRTGPRQLELLQPRGFLREPTSAFFRSLAAPLRPGDVVTTIAYRVEVLEVSAAGHPTRLRFEFTADLDHRSLCFATWDGRDYAPLALPPPGASVTLPGLAPL
ncbi:hypothetical protein [Nannocystis sp. SCPEA4]|uniref:hypothetical protein n=1 Tax=Nannocystis sp. SCPEA4 TaxID=2996787 RepID=UPI0022717CBE|nr:hypothetical protein [Nannocystis sp. SCPEA4]MCY1057602.1 hypothetical protein [Nannocystis sp. SCPEA4]